LINETDGEGTAEGELRFPLLFRGGLFAWRILLEWAD
jgi:hypothetical protein